MSLFKGTYVFKQNGKEIGRSENLITTNGITSILKYLSGHSAEWASTIAVGAIGSSPSINDLALKYEIARSAITLKSYRSGSPNVLIVKGQLDPLIAANIYEVGIFPAETNKVFGERDKLIITDFSTPEDWTITDGSFTAIPYQAQGPFSPRIGLYNLQLDPVTTIYNDNFAANLVSYTTLDSLDILVNVDSTVSAGTLTVKLEDTSGNNVEMQYGYNGTITSGYQILSLNFPSTINSLSTISKITLTSNNSITVDAIRVSILNEISTSSALISRSVLETPIAKLYAVPLDIEYYLQMG